MIHTHEIRMTTAVNEERESLVYALLNLTSNDDDFNGNNGEEYLWNVAKEEGFKSNLAYVENNLLHLPESWGTNQIISRFIELWLGQDGYYDSYDYDYTLCSNGNIVIAVSYVHED